MLINNDNYFQVLESVKARIQDAQYRAVLGVNREQILLFWNIGKVIIENSKYGSGFIENLASDIKSEFPNAKGYSVRNLRYMRKFAELVTDEEKVQTLSALLSWSHNTYLFDKRKIRGEHFAEVSKMIIILPYEQPTVVGSSPISSSRKRTL
ncbi:MAG TPA: DUF1016 N-terminal domain-containing protein [Clostridia bacterium]|nr:DUF1016 N-terminal domain-containing protein [Clostridia bacterium]